MKERYSYTIKGSKEEIEEVLLLLKEVEEGVLESERLTKEIAKKLIKTSKGIEEDIKKEGRYKVTFENKTESKVKRVPFNLEEMPSILSEIFEEMFVEGEWYREGKAPVTYFVSEVGENTYTKEYGEEIYYADESNVDEENGVLSIECPVCSYPLEIQVEREELEKGYAYYEGEIECKCGVPINVEYESRI